jgi:hypothetical protein
MICADRPFRINQLTARLNMPTVLLCATDGYFNYVSSPAHFEYLLLHTLSQSETLQTWVQALKRAVQDYSSDDASLVIVALGYSNFGAVREEFASRSRFLTENYIRPLSEIRGPDRRQEFTAVRQSCWDQYRPGYEELLRRMEAGQ